MEIHFALPFSFSSDFWWGIGIGFTSLPVAMYLFFKDYNVFPA